MRELQRRIVAEFGVNPEIDPAAEVERRVSFLIDYARAAHAKGFVLGISGGVDSSLAGRLGTLAAERMGGEFVAVRLPYRSQVDAADAEAAMVWVDAPTQLTANIAPAVDALADECAAHGWPLGDFNKGNVKARLRMTAQYALAGERGLLVIGTDHAAEGIVGFYTKFGDGGADLLPLAGLNKRQVRAIARHLGAPEHLWAKVPTADLLDGTPLRPDEDELGIPYEAIDDYLEGKAVPDEVAEEIERRWRISRHKRTTPATPSDTWWRS